MEAEVMLKDAFVSREASFRKGFEEKIDEHCWLLNAMRCQDKDHLAARINACALPLSSSLGYEIIQTSDLKSFVDYLDDPKGTLRGTMGFYLSLKSVETTTYGLISRHVALGNNRLDDSLGYKDSRETHVFHMSYPCSLTGCWKKTTNYKSEVEDTITMFQRQIFKGTPLRARRTKWLLTKSF